MRPEFIFNLSGGENRLVYLNRQSAEGGRAEKPNDAKKAPAPLSSLEDVFGPEKKAGDKKVAEGVRTLEKLEDQNVKKVAATEAALARIDRSLIAPVDPQDPDGLKLYQKMLGLTATETNYVAGALGTINSRVVARVEQLQKDLGFKGADADGILGLKTLSAVADKGLLAGPNRTKVVANVYNSLFTTSKLHVVSQAKADRAAALAKASVKPKAAAATLAATTTPAPSPEAPVLNAAERTVISGLDLAHTQEGWPKVDGVTIHVNPANKEGVAGANIGERGSEKFYSQAQIDAIQGKPKAVGATLAAGPTAAPDKNPFDSLDANTQSMLVAAVQRAGMDAAGSGSNQQFSFDFNGTKINVKGENDGSYSIGEKGKEKSYSKDVIDAATRAA